MRYASIDVLRTAAVLLMVAVHLLENLSGVDWAPAGLGAPTFGFLVGVSYRLWARAQVERGRSDERITAATLKRGAFLFVAGILFNVAVWLPGDAFNWDVLTLLGTAMALLGLIREQPPAVPLLVAALAFVAAPVLRLHSGYADYWADGYYDPDWTLAQLSLGYLVNGYFPVFPWLYFPMVGYASGARLDGTAPTWRRLRPLAWAGLAFLAAWGALRLARPYHGVSALSGWTMFPASVEYLTGTTGLILTAFALAAWWIDGRGGLSGVPGVLSFCRTMSAHSFTIYVLHHVMHVWPLWAAAVLTGQAETTHYWRQAMPWPVALALVPACVGACYGACRWLERGRRPSMESLMRRACDA